MNEYSLAKAQLQVLISSPRYQTKLKMRWKYMQTLMIGGER